MASERGRGQTGGFILRGCGLTQRQHSLAEWYGTVSYTHLFGELPGVCPSQQRARTLCLQLAACVAADGGLRGDFRRTGRLPQGELARRFQISVKMCIRDRGSSKAILLVGDICPLNVLLRKTAAFIIIEETSLSPQEVRLMPIKVPDSLPARAVLELSLIHI